MVERRPEIVEEFSEDDRPGNGRGSAPYPSSDQLAFLDVALDFNTPSRVRVVFYEGVKLRLEEIAVFARPVDLGADTV